MARSSTKVSQYDVTCPSLSFRLSLQHSSISQNELTRPKVSRITAKSHNLSMFLTLDIAVELYPLSAGETFTLALARSLVPDEDDQDLDGDQDLEGDRPKRIKRELWRGGDQGLAADYEYVLYGKVCILISPDINHGADGKVDLQV